MTPSLLALYWASAALLVAVFVAYPLAVLARGRWRPRPIAKADVNLPVTVVVAAHNEARSIGDRIDNLLGQDYPPALVEVIVASDGSTDGTDAIAAAYAGRGVQLLSLPRGGKVAALNRAVAAASGEIIAFTDANTVWAPDALRRLLRPFADPDVGGVAGDQRYLASGAESASGSGERSYWDFERRLKLAQSQAGSVTSATGAIYAVRAELAAPLPEGVSDDFVMSARVVERHRRLVFEPGAVAYEPVAPSNGDELGRKLRSIQLGLAGVAAVRGLLNPFRHGLDAVGLAVQKVLRRLAVLPLVGLFLASVALWGAGPVYQLTALAGGAFLALAVLGLAFGGSRPGRMKLFSLPAYVCLVYAASALAAVRVVRGRRLTTWDTVRQHLEEAEAA